MLRQSIKKQTATSPLEDSQTVELVQRLIETIRKIYIDLSLIPLSNPYKQLSDAELEIIRNNIFRALQENYTTPEELENTSPYKIKQVFENQNAMIALEQDIFTLSEINQTSLNTFEKLMTGKGLGLLINIKGKTSISELATLGEEQLEDAIEKGNIEEQSLSETQIVEKLVAEIKNFYTPTSLFGSINLSKIRDNLSLALKFQAVQASELESVTILTVKQIFGNDYATKALIERLCTLEELDPIQRGTIDALMTEKGLILLRNTKDRVSVGFLAKQHQLNDLIEKGDVDKELEMQYQKERQAAMKSQRVMPGFKGLR